MNTSKSIAAAVFCLLLSACGGSSGTRSPATTPTGGSNSGGSPNVLKAYLANSPYESVIASCVDDLVCSLNQLPLIGLDHPDPSVDEIMDHVVVSHDWMGQRFRNLLIQMPQQIRLLFGGVTAVVIASDIRPSHYRTATGAIYLDPALLWLTNAEKATIDQTPDFRSDFGKDMQFIRVWRYVIGNEYAWNSYSLDDNVERTLEDTIVGFSWLLYHELAHANDCASIEQQQSFDRSLSFWDNAENVYDAGACVYQQLTEQLPLQSQVWLDLAQIYFQGATPNSTQLAMTAEQAGAEFANDYAMDAYSYSTVREDLAMAFEAVMMKQHFNADRDVAMVAQFTDFTCDNAKIKWGQRGRLAEADVMTRSKFVSDRILPNLDLSDVYQSLGDAIDVPYNQSWCDLNLTGRAMARDENYGLKAAAFAKATEQAIKHGYRIE